MHKKNHGTNLLKSVHKFQRFCFAYMHSYWYILLLHIHKPFLNSFAQLLLLGSESISLALLKNPILFCNAFLVESFSSSWKNFSLIVMTVFLRNDKANFTKTNKSVETLSLEIINYAKVQIIIHAIILCITL